MPAAQWPSIAPTWGTTPDSVTCSRKRAPAPAKVEPLRRLDAGAARVEQPDDRDALAQRQLAHAGGLALPDLAHGAGEHGEVVGDDGDAPAVDVADAGDDAVGREVALGGEAGVHRVGELAVLDERARVDQQVDALPDRELAHAALAGDPLVAAHGEGGGASLPEVVDQRLPVVQVRVRRRHRAASLPQVISQAHA